MNSQTDLLCSLADEPYESQDESEYYIESQLQNIFVW